MIRANAVSVNSHAFVLQIHPKDNVAVALRDLSLGQNAGQVTALDNVPAGHKMALRIIRKGEAIVKYGYSIGIARSDIQRGQYVHVHNVASALAEKLELGGFVADRDASQVNSQKSTSSARATIEGFRRPNGSE